MTRDSLSVQVRELTARGAGGVSVLGLIGQDVLGLLRLWGVRDAKVGELKFCRLSVGGEVLDEALVCVQSAEQAEVHVHGSRPLVRRLCEQGGDAIQNDGNEGRYGRMRQALAAAPCELAARILLDQLEGAWSRECAHLATLGAQELRVGLVAWLKRSTELRWAFEPARVLIAGPVNAGKSTLFNALVGDERAITSDVEGTTRDLVAERVMLGVWPVELLDSAGQREVADGLVHGELERAGQQLAREESDRVDWVLWLAPGVIEPPMNWKTGTVRSVLRSCRDLPGGAPDGISALFDPADAVGRVCALFEDALGLPEDPWTRGTAVAFDADSRGWLEALLESEPAAAQRELRAAVAG